jgi:SAM-dependent methyltransferase
MGAMSQSEPFTDAAASEKILDTTPFVALPCLICGGEEVDIIASSEDIEAQQRFLQEFHQRRTRKKGSEELADRADFTQDYATRIVTCRRCGFIYRSPRPTASAVTAAYVTDRYGDAHLEAEFLNQHEWAGDKAAALAAWAQFRNNPVIVEVGSFVGGFLYAGRQRGWTMLGVDPGKEVTEFCRARGLPVFCGTLADAPVKAASVDAVVIWNTFDQLPNPDTTLSAARTVLNKDGALVIRVPNGHMYRRGTERLRRRGPIRQWMITALAWNNLLAFPYLHGYSISTMDQLLGRHGFTRLKFDRDQLVSLSDPDTKAWARAEEKVMKWLCRCLGSAESLWSSESTAFTPWLDLYYGLGEVVNRTPLAVATSPKGRLRTDTLSDCPVVPGKEEILS